MSRKTTPARQQYLDFKAQYPDSLVFFRLGDFFELFDQDAITSARELDLTLTSRSHSGAEEDRVPMAGVPHHAVEAYIARLVEKGYRVVVVDQIGSEPINGIVPRKVTQIVTPGTVTELSQLRGNENHYLMALAFDGGGAGAGFARAGIAYADITTGEFAATQVEDEAAAIKVLEEILRLNPREVLAAKSWAERGLTLPPHSHLSAWNDAYFDPRQAAQTLLRHFRVASLAGFGLDDSPLAVSAAGALMAYLNETQRGNLGQVVSLRRYSTEDFMRLDAATRRSLELTETMRGGSLQGSLLGVLDRTLTPMGGRLLRQWVGQPLLDLKRLNARLDAVEALHSEGTLRAALAPHLKAIGDLERLMNRILAGRSGPREVLALAQGLRAVPRLRVALLNRPALEAIYERLDPCESVVNQIEDALSDEAPAVMNVIGTIRQGFSSELDALYRASDEARRYIANLEEVERARTGIKTLKVGYNKVFGYYIEVSKGASERVPANYQRKQTLVNAERYITPEMKHYENIILNADERMLALERQLFEALLGRLTASGAVVLKTARAVAHLDALLSLAEVAAREGYTRPHLSHEDRLIIRAGRHPVVEQTLPKGEFVPNDCFLNAEERIHLVTGPNMAGKSTVLRQTALITLMAQIGAFVPAESAEIGLVDRIFTRVGAQDEIHAGQSTFMVEMLETANILAHATPRSLVILDEVGRGTSTYDGMAIARAVLEYLHNNPRLNPKTLFATHYHELTVLEDILPRVVNYQVAVAEEGERVVFLHRLIRGKADRSYGVHVAALAGVPSGVVRRAQEILQELEAQGSNFALKERPANPHQISIFDDSHHPALEALRQLDVNQLSPLDALTKLYELQRLARGG